MSIRYQIEVKLQNFAISDTITLCIEAINRVEEAIGIDDHAYFTHKNQEFMVIQTHPGRLQIQRPSTYH